jgi:hypothetical protein
MPAQRGSSGVGRVPVQRLGERLIGRTDLLVAAPIQHDRALSEGGLGDLGGRAGLANSGLTTQQYSPARPGRRLLASLLQAPQQLITADVAD